MVRGRIQCSACGVFSDHDVRTCPDDRAVVAWRLERLAEYFEAYYSGAWFTREARRLAVRARRVDQAR